MGPISYMLSVSLRNVVMRRVPVYRHFVPGTGWHRQWTRRRLWEHLGPLDIKRSAQKRCQIFRPHHEDLRMRNYVAWDPRGDDGDAEVYPAYGRGPISAQSGAEIPAGCGPW